MIRFGALRPLFDAHLRQATGTLDAQASDGRWRLGLRAGRVVHVEGCPALLAAAGVSTGGDLTQAIGAAVAAGVPMDQAFRAAEDGLARALLSLAEDPAGRLRFDSTDTPPRDAFPLPTPMLRMLARAFADRSAALPRALKGRRLRWKGPGEVRGLNPVEQRVASCAGKRLPLGETVALIGRGDPPRERQVWATVEMMLATGLVDLDAEARAMAPRTTARDREADARVRALREKIARRKESRSASEPSQGPVAAPPPARSQPASELEQLQAAERALAEQPPLERLGLSGAPSLDAMSLTAAFREVGARYHPDRYAADSAEVRAIAGRVFALISTAFDALREPEALEHARRTLEARAKGEVYVDEISAGKARVYFRKAEVAFRRRNRPLAKELIDQSVALDPSALDALILQVFCQVFSRSLDPDDGLKRLSALTPSTPSEEVAVFFACGRLLKFLDRSDEAVKAFRRVLRIDADHQDAKREIWLHERRSGEPESTAVRMMNIFGNRG